MNKIGYWPVEEILCASVLFVVSLLSGCVSAPKVDNHGIPVVALSQVPLAVRTTINSVARGRRVEKINRVCPLEGPVFRVYIQDKPGSQILTLDGNGKILDNAVAINMSELPDPVLEATRTAVAGKLQTCRRSVHRPGGTYVIDYLIGNDEPVFALIETNGFVCAVFGYAQDDPD